MLCPYCAEEIKDGAILCKHCDHDLAAFAPLHAKIRELQDTVEELRTENAELRAKAPEQVSEGLLPTWKERFPYVGAAVVSAACALSVYLDHATQGSYNIAFVVPLVSAPLWGLLLGLLRPSIRARIGAVLSLCVGAAAAIAIGLADTSDFDWTVLLSWAIASSFSYVSILCGSALAKALRRNRPRGVADVIARKILGHGASVRHPNRVKQLATVISAVAPILTLVGTIITAYFGYLASISKK